VVKVRQYAQRPLAQEKQVVVVGVDIESIANGVKTTCGDAVINALINSSSPALEGQYDQSAL
jgi:hypothetical protein